MAPFVSSSKSVAAYAALAMVYTGLVWTDAAWLVVPYHLVSRLAYVSYVGWSLKAEDESGRLSRRYGAEQGFRRFRQVAALIMNNDAVSLVVAGWVTRGTLKFPAPHAVMAIGGAALLIGVSVKVWAAWTLGVSGYYWGDFFVPVQQRRTGLYRFLRNPMYTIGYLPAYGIALLLGSLPGLALAVVDHATIFLLYRWVEKPHYERLYGGGT